MAAIRVVLADDNPRLRGQLRALLECEPDIKVVAEAQDGLQAVRMVEAGLRAGLAPDLLILDMQLPALDGLAVIRELRAAGAPVQILVVSGHAEPHYIQAMLANGASGYLTKDEVPELLVAAVRGIMAGEQGWLSQRACAQLARRA